MYGVRLYGQNSIQNQGCVPAFQKPIEHLRMSVPPLSIYLCNISLILKSSSISDMFCSLLGSLAETAAVWEHSSSTGDLYLPMHRLVYLLLVSFIPTGIGRSLMANVLQYASAPSVI
jgi:hypothetical protein